MRGCCLARLQIGPDWETSDRLRDRASRRLEPVAVHFCWTSIRILHSHHFHRQYTARTRLRPLTSKVASSLMAKNMLKYVPIPAYDSSFNDRIPQLMMQVPRANTQQVRVEPSLALPYEARWRASTAIVRPMTT
jgi:hypothetical protein